MSSQRIPTRAETDPRFTWNAESVFVNIEAWEAEFATIAQLVTHLGRFQGHLADGPTVLAEALTACDDLTRRLGRLEAYANMAHAVDRTDQAAGQRFGRFQGLHGQALAAMAFVGPELLAIGRPSLEDWMRTEPGLAIYGHKIDDLFRQQAHMRSYEVEQVLGLASDPLHGSYNIFSALTDADFQFEPALDSQGQQQPVAQSTLNGILHGADREARRTAWENYADEYLAFKNTLATNYITSVKQNVFQMRARRYRSTLEMALFKDAIPVEVFSNLIDTFQQFLPIWHRYWAVRRKALGVDRLHPYDVWAPLTAQPPRIDYAQAVDWICQSMAPLGDEYVRILRKGCLEDRWIDVYPNQGKGSGAFSSGRPGTLPFILMSYSEDAISLGTLAHELGHSMHSYLAWQAQPTVYGEYSLFIAEVASNFHQAMLRAHLLSLDLDHSLQIAIIEEAMSNFHRYFLVMPTLARFELEVHKRIEQGEGITADRMIDLLADLSAEGFGDAVALDRKRVGIQWATFPHLFEDYYVFQYATGISGAHALAHRVLSGTPGAADAYLAMLKAGGSIYPLDALKIAGVDLTTPEPVRETFAVLAGLIDRLELLVEG